MKQSEITKIQYTRSTNIGGTQGETTTRHIIPTFVPSANVKALDVSDLDEQSRDLISFLYKEYADFYTQQLKNIPSFTNWLEQTQGVMMEDDIKWRTFKLDNITEV